MIDLSRVIELQAAPATVWETLWDVPAVARCIPGCQKVEEVEARRRYRSTIADRVGPFKITIPFDIRVDAVAGSRRLEMKAAGRDAILGSPVNVSLAATVEAEGSGTRLTLEGAGEVGGKLAALGQGVIERKTRDILNGFIAALDQLLRHRTDARAV